MNQQQIYAKKQKSLERKIAKIKAEQEQLQAEQRVYEQASKIADSHVLRLKDYVVADIKSNISAENLKRWEEIFQTIYDCAKRSENEIEDKFQLKIPLELED
jgi:hypothetical protein